MRKKVVFIGNIGLVINSFVKDYISALSKDYDVYVIYNTMTEPLNINFPESVKVIHYPIKRKFSFSDILFFFFITNFYYKHRIDASISITPKVGYISNISGFLARVPTRIHFFTGQIWINLKGVKRRILKSFDKSLFYSATHRIVDSPTQFEFLESEGFSVNSNSYFVHKGSICGVDVERFQKNESDRKKIREQFNIQNQIVLLYVGRLDRDKGILDLLDAFEAIDRTDLSLLLVGPDEMNIQSVLPQYTTAQRVIYAGMTDKPEVFYSAGDIFCYVSYREGFGLSAIEAAACSLPVIGTNIVGLRDAIKHEETGILIESGNISELKKTINTLSSNIELCKKMGKNAREFVTLYFSREIVQSEYLKLLKDIIK